MKQKKFHQIGKNIHITKFKFKCINGCGEEIPFSDIPKHYNKKCKNIKKPKKLEKPIVQDNEHKQLNILSPQQVAKLKKNSSAGGHNGIKSIIHSMGSNEFPRLKIGISNDKTMDTKDYVLGRLSKRELEELDNLQTTFNKIINCYIKEGIDRAMNIYNTKK